VNNQRVALSPRNYNADYRVVFFNVGAQEIGTDVPTLSILDGSVDPTVAAAEDEMLHYNSQLIIANNGNGKTATNVSLEHP